MQLEVANYPDERGGVSGPSARSAHATPLASYKFLKPVVVLAWSVVLAATCGRALVWPRAHSVYSIYAGAGRNWVVGAALYESTEHAYRYSPFATLLFVPFGQMPESVGGCLWRLLNAALMLVGLALWTRDLLPTSLARTQRRMLWLLIAPLAVGNLHNGQSNPLILGLLLIGASAVSRERWRLAAASIAIASLFKVYPIAVGLLLALVHPRRFGGRFVIYLAAGITLPFLFQHSGYVTDQYAAWLQHLGRDDRHALPPVDRYRDLRLLLDNCGASIGQATFVAVQAITACAIAIGIARRSARAGDDPMARRRMLALLLALASIWMTVVGSAAESATYLLLAPAAAWAVIDGSVHYGFRTTVIAWLSYGLFLAAQMANWFPFARQFHATGVQALAGLLLLLAITVREWGRRDSTLVPRVVSV